MTTAKEIEKAIESLPQSELREFRAWFLEYDARVWDEKFAEDASSARLAEIAKRAISEHKSGKTKTI